MLFQTKRGKKKRKIHLNGISMVSHCRKDFRPQNSMKFRIVERTHLILMPRGAIILILIFISHRYDYTTYIFVAYSKLMAGNRLSLSPSMLVRVCSFFCLIFTILFHMNLKLCYTFWMNFMTWSLVCDCNIFFECLHSKFEMDGR